MTSSSLPCFLSLSFLVLVVALEKLHAKHALPGFADRTAEEREIEAATTEITKVYPFMDYFTSPPRAYSCSICFMLVDRIFDGVTL